MHIPIVRVCAHHAAGREKSGSRPDRHTHARRKAGGWGKTAQARAPGRFRNAEGQRDKEHTHCTAACARGSTAVRASGSKNQDRRGPRAWSPSRQDNCHPHTSHAYVPALPWVNGGDGYLVQYPHIKSQAPEDTGKAATKRSKGTLTAAALMIPISGDASSSMRTAIYLLGQGRLTTYANDRRFYSYPIKAGVVIFRFLLLLCQILLLILDQGVQADETKMTYNVQEREQGGR